MDFGDVNELARFLSDEAKDPARPLLPDGSRIGNWQVLAYLGGGGFGEVYRVKHHDLRLVCALKLPRGGSQEHYARFMREVRFISRQTDSRFPRFYEYGTDEGRPYLIMELLEPCDLPKGERKIAEFMLSLCETTQLLHNQGFVHRDIKPSNILYRPGSRRPILVDFGLVKEIGLTGANSTNDLTKECKVVGTRRYAAPEQLSGETIADVADVHSLGVLADACFCQNAPRRWRRIIQRATSSLPEQRYASVGHLEHAIRFRYLSVWLTVFLAGCILVVSVIIVNAVSLKNDETREAVDDANISTESDDGKDDRGAVNLIRGTRNSSDSAAEWL